jgi:hypothetical protein
VPSQSWSGVRTSPFLPIHLTHRVIRTNRDSVNVRCHLKSLAKHWTLCLSDEPYALQTFVMCPSLYRTSWYCGTRDCKLNLFQNENHMQINASTLHLSISRARPIREYIHWILQVHGIEYVYLSLRLGTSLRFQFVLPPPCPCIIENVSESRYPALGKARSLDTQNGRHLHLILILFEPYIAA